MQDLFSELDSRSQSIRYARTSFEIMHRIEREDIKLILLPERHPYLKGIRDHVYFEGSDHHDGFIGTLKGIPVVVNMVHPPKHMRPQMVYMLDKHAEQILRKLVC